MAQRTVITFILLVCFMWMPAVGYVSGFNDIAAHFLYPFSHANIFHLAGNLLCLWMLRCPLHVIASFVIAVVCSFLPCFTDEPTMGFSGLLFAMVGIAYGRVHRFSDMCRKCLPFVLVTIFVPHVNAFIHIYCLMLGYVYGLTGWSDPFAKYDPYNVNLCAKR